MIGFSNAVGLAIAQAHTAAVFNRPGLDIIGSLQTLVT
jgi:transketolase